MPIERPANIFCDNEAVTNVARRPKVTLSKKHNSIAFHKVREAVTSKMCCVAWEDTSNNLVDILTKTKTRAEHKAIIDCFMY